MSDLLVDRAEVFALGPPGERHSWASNLPEMYTVGVSLRLTTRGGLVGLSAVKNFTPHDFDHSVAETLRPMLPMLIGADPLVRENFCLKPTNRLIQAEPQAQSAIDIALWDLAAKHDGLPLYQYLGGSHQGAELRIHPRAARCRGLRGLRERTHGPRLHRHEAHCRGAE